MEFMGAYERSAMKANGFPLYVKKLEDGSMHWLYRSGNGTWVVTPGPESNVAKGVGNICSKRVADLPTEAGLTWRYHDGKTWVDDPNMTCITEVNAPLWKMPRLKLSPNSVTKYHLAFYVTSFK